jgi:NADH-quinone oxidoreductase E subunit
MNTLHDTQAAEPHNPSDVFFTAEENERIERIKAQYPETQAALMPVLWIAQKKFGWLSTTVMQYVAQTLDLPFSHVQGVATFYTMYWKKPMGAHHVQVCTNISCLLRGGEQLLEQAQRELKIGHMERTPDGRFSLEEVECMGACGGAPMIAINERYFENVTKEQFARLLDEPEGYDKRS